MGWLWRWSPTTVWGLSGWCLWRRSCFRACHETNRPTKNGSGGKKITLRIVSRIARTTLDVLLTTASFWLRPKVLGSFPFISFQVLIYLLIRQHGNWRAWNDKDAHDLKKKKMFLYVSSEGCGEVEREKIDCVGITQSGVTCLLSWGKNGGKNTGTPGLRKWEIVCFLWLSLDLFRDSLVGWQLAFLWKNWHSNTYCAFKV